jgi:hypothetical protein
LEEGELKLVEKAMEEMKFLIGKVKRWKQSSWMKTTKGKSSRHATMLWRQRGHRKGSETQST